MELLNNVLEKIGPRYGDETEQRPLDLSLARLVNLAAGTGVWKRAQAGPWATKPAPRSPAVGIHSRIEGARTRERSEHGVDPPGQQRATSDGDDNMFGRPASQLVSRSVGRFGRGGQVTKGLEGVGRDRVGWEGMGERVTRRREGGGINAAWRHGIHLRA